MPTHTIVADWELEPALETPPYIVEWTPKSVAWYEIHLPATHREHYVKIDVQPIGMRDEKFVASFTTNVWTRRRPRRTLAVGQCASLVAALWAPIVLRAVWGSNVALAALVPLLWVLGVAVSSTALRNWRG